MFHHLVFCLEDLVAVRTLAHTLAFMDRVVAIEVRALIEFACATGMIALKSTLFHM